MPTKLESLLMAKLWKGHRAAGKAISMTLFGSQEIPKSKEIENSILESQPPRS
jgi:hypothetical protein